MHPDDPVVNPVKGKNAPDIGAFAVMVSNGGDLKALSGSELVGVSARRLMMSHLYMDKESPCRFSFTGPVVGAPYAVMLLETIISWGASEILFLGWCGAISEGLSIGDILVPNGAIIDEGTSLHYGGMPSSAVPVSRHTQARIMSALESEGLAYQQGLVWSTDAIYRETIQKIKHFRNLQAIAVEMELSALLTVGRFRRVNVGALLVVSDELTTFHWKPGFKDERFCKSRSVAIETMKKLCRESK